MGHAGRSLLRISFLENKQIPVNNLPVLDLSPIPTTISLIAQLFASMPLHAPPCCSEEYDHTFLSNTATGAFITETLCQFSPQAICGCNAHDLLTHPELKHTRHFFQGCRDIPPRKKIELFSVENFATGKDIPRKTYTKSALEHLPVDG
jgi:hypothetical protein